MGKVPDKGRITIYIRSGKQSQKTDWEKLKVGRGKWGGKDWSQRGAGICLPIFRVPIQHPRVEAPSNFWNIWLWLTDLWALRWQVLFHPPCPAGITRGPKHPAHPGAITHLCAHRIDDEHLITTLSVIYIPTHRRFFPLVMPSALTAVLTGSILQVSLQSWVVFSWPLLITSLQFFGKLPTNSTHLLV